VFDQLKPQQQGRAGCHRFSARRPDFKPGQPQMRGEQTGQGDRSHQQGQQQRGVVVVVQCAQQHHRQQRAEQAEAGGQQVDAVPVQHHRQGLGTAWPGQSLEALAQAFAP
jgi:hypothetical protein